MNILNFTGPVLIMLVLQFPIFAQVDVQVPTLDEHRFVSNRLIHDPFIKTRFELNFGLGESQRINYPGLSLGDTTLLTTRGSIAFGALGLDYDQRVTDWMAMYFSFQSLARVGTEPRGILTQGLNTILGFDLGWKFKVLERKKHLLSVSTGLSNYNGNFVNVLAYVRDIIDKAPNPSISQDVPVLSGNLGVSYAWGISSLVGFQGWAELAYGESFERGQNEFNYSLSGAVDINLYPKTNIPLGVSLAGEFTASPEYTLTQQQNIYAYNLALAYTGASDLIISVDFWTYQSPIVLDAIEISSSKIQVNAITLQMTYWFN